MSQDPLAPRYRSGDEVTLEAGGITLRFNRHDFGRRVAAAAGRLGLVDAARTGTDERADLSAIAIHGHAARPRTALAAHLDRHRAQLVHDGRDLAYWLRRLVFRDAWLDQQVTDGHLHPVFTQGRGFTYRSAATGAPTADGATAPDWSAHAHRGAAA